jgi:hypothetical protein
VTIEDRFLTPALPVTLRYPHRLCAPADKNEEGIVDPVQHLVGYEELRTPFTKQSAIGVSNQFGQLSIDLTRRDVLMVPSAKELQSTPPPLQPPLIDHFQCYRAKRAKGSAKFAKITVNVSDQIETNVPITLTRPYRLCVPANKNGEDPTAPSHPNNLLCYRSKSSVRFGTVPAFIDNQFGNDDLLLIHRRELCVPTVLLNP